MSRFRSRVALVAALSAAVGGLTLVASFNASASAAVNTRTCSGTATSPGVLAGTYSGNVRVKGVCAVDAGIAVVKGNLTVEPQGVLLASYALNDRTHHGASSLTVTKNVVVSRDATAILGCEAEKFGFGCLDDTGKPPTLQSRATIDGSLFAYGALAVIMHNSSVGGFVVQRGGGGGLTCTPEGIFKAFKLPVYSDYEAVVVGDSMSVTGLHSCWLGVVATAVHGSLTVSKNKMADPDANEIASNFVNRSLTCWANSPAVQYGDSGDNPNIVSGTATGECSFHRLVANPAPDGTREPISLRATA